MALSTVAGIGGGGVAIPLAMYFFDLRMASKSDLPLKPAISISSLSILIVTTARFIFNFNEKHPEKPQCTAIDYGLTNVMMPLTMIGSLSGAYFFISFPDIVLQVLLTALLFVLTIHSIRKYLEQRNKENESQLNLNFEVQTVHDHQTLEDKFHPEKNAATNLEQYAEVSIPMQDSKSHSISASDVTPKGSVNSGNSAPITPTLQANKKSVIT